MNRADMSDAQQLSVLRNLKISLFHLASGMADVVATGVWNRVMISDLGYSATPIGLLVSLRYFLAPLGVWAGQQSDQRRLFGFRRLGWIGLGRLMMVISIIALGYTTAHLARGNAANLAEWGVMSAAMLLFSLGTAISGSTFLALLHDRSGEKQRGRVIGVVWTMLLVGFSVGGAMFGILLPAKKDATLTGLSFAPDTLQNAFLIGAAVMGALWLFSMWGEETRKASLSANKEGAEAGGASPRPYVAQDGVKGGASSIRADLRLAWSNTQTRAFFWYLSLSMLFAFSQDLILEPFAGQVFGMDAAHTTRFTAYWGSMAILASLVVLGLMRRFPKLDNTRLNYIGVGMLVLTFGLLAISAFAQARPLVTISLITLGIGLGVWNIGTTGMMMEMSPFGRAGTFLGFWTMVVTLARGIGVSGSGIARDLLLGLTGNLALSYGIIFVVAGFGLVVSLLVLRRINVQAFQREQGVSLKPETSAVLAGSLD